MTIPSQPNCSSYIRLDGCLIFTLHSQMLLHIKFKCSFQFLFKLPTKSAFFPDYFHFRYGFSDFRLCLLYFGRRTLQTLVWRAVCVSVCVYVCGFFSHCPFLFFSSIFGWFSFSFSPHFSKSCSFFLFFLSLSFLLSIEMIMLAHFTMSFQPESVPENCVAFIWFCVVISFASVSAFGLMLYLLVLFYCRHGRI